MICLDNVFETHPELKAAQESLNALQADFDRLQIDRDKLSDGLDALSSETGQPVDVNTAPRFA